MAQQTALEQFIEWIDSDCTPMDCVMKAKELLKVEKQQQENAWDAAFGEGIGTTMGSVDYDAKFINWYTEIYGSYPNKQKLYSEEDVKFIATRFAHECRRKHPVTNNETIILFNEWFKQHK